MNKTMRFFIIALAAFAVLGLMACSNNDEQAITEETPLAVEPETSGRAVVGYTVERGSLASAVEVSGTVEGIREATVQSETQGVLLEVLVDLGQNVKAGDVLLKFDDQVERAALRQAESQYESARLEVDGIQWQFDRGSASKAQLVRAQAAAAGAESALAQAQRNFDNRTIRAPIDGAVADIARSVSPGNLIGPGTQVLRIVDTGKLKMRVGVGQNAVARIEPGNIVQVTVPSVSSKPYEAVVRSVGAAADPTTGSFPVIVEWDNSVETPVRAGASGIAMIYDSSAGQSLIVPAAAIDSRNSETVVFIEEDDRAVQKTVVLAGKRGARAAVLEGINDGDVIIATGIASLQNGDPVLIDLAGSSLDLR
ncbi:MAG: efflux RND transporter periplasmic adaptor subunit [Spirochaetaceae bacterium]|nr:MAG: efflux RND transporter periplasmic adaptor subunit [Spirochaetaceae bacterium]